MNRFAARAITSNWYVYEADGDLVIPDLGFGINLIGDFEGKDVVGLILPIGRRHVLELVPVPDRETAYRTAGGDWKVPIVHGPSAGTSLELNKCLAQCAQDFITGTEAAVDPVSSDDMAKFEPAAIDSILNQWPFNLDTRVLAGIHAPLERLLHNETFGSRPVDTGPVRRGRRTRSGHRLSIRAFRSVCPGKLFPRPLGHCHLRAGPRSYDEAAVTPAGNEDLSVTVSLPLVRHVTWWKLDPMHRRRFKS